MTDTPVKESCTHECNPAAVPPVCGVCNDIRFVCTKPTQRRYAGGNTASEVFPCPACGHHLVDGDGKKYSIPGRRYGNPLIHAEDDYFKWRYRNREKDPGWQDLPLFESEKQHFKHLQQTYPAADLRWVRIWVLGERRVISGP